MWVHTLIYTCAYLHACVYNGYMIYVYIYRYTSMNIYIYICTKITKLQPMTTNNTSIHTCVCVHEHMQVSMYMYINLRVTILGISQFVFIQFWMDLGGDFGWFLNGLKLGGLI